MHRISRHTQHSTSKGFAGCSRASNARLGLAVCLCICSSCAECVRPCCPLPATPLPSLRCAAAEVKGGGDSDGEEGSAAPKAKPKPAKRARKAGSDDEDGSGKRKGTGFGKPLPLSDALAAACGKSEMNRGELCKWLYAYCDEHNLKVGVRC